MREREPPGDGVEQANGALPLLGGGGRSRVPAGDVHCPPRVPAAPRRGHRRCGGAVLIDPDLQELRELVWRQAGLSEDRGDDRPLEVPGMNGNGDEPARSLRMFEIVVAACGVVKEEPRSLEGPYDFTGPERRQSGGHAAGTETLTVSLIGWRSGVSRGIGRPSFCRLSM